MADTAELKMSFANCRGAGPTAVWKEGVSDIKIN
jgi:hypothetical protein